MSYGYEAGAYGAEGAANGAVRGRGRGRGFRGMRGGRGRGRGRGGFRGRGRGGGYGPSYGSAGGAGYQGKRYDPMFGGKSGQSKTNVYVSGFPNEWTNVELRALFSTYGTISEVRVVTRSTETQPDRGVGFVHFSNAASANQAVKELSGATPEGCNGELTIRMANSNKNAPPEFLNTMRVNILNMEQHGWNIESSTNLYVSQLPNHWNEAQVRQLYEPYGTITELRLLPPKDDQGRVAFVHYESPDSATKAIAATWQMTPDGSETPISVRFSNIKPKNYPEWFEPKHLAMMEATSNVYLTQIPTGWTNENVKRVFAQYGNILDLRVLSKRQRDDANAGVAFVHYDEEISAIKAVANANSTMPEGCSVPMIVQFAKVHPSIFEQEIAQMYAAMGRPVPGAAAAAGGGGYAAAPPAAAAYAAAPAYADPYAAGGYYEEAYDDGTGAAAAAAGYGGYDPAAAAAAAYDDGTGGFYEEAYESAAAYDEYGVAAAAAPAAVWAGGYAPAAAAVFAPRGRGRGATGVGFRGGRGRGRGVRGAGGFRGRGRGRGMTAAAVWG